MNRTVRRMLAAGALALPLTLGAVGIASADTYYTDSTATAGPDGASHSATYSSTDNDNDGWNGGDNTAVYYQSNSAASTTGASSDYTFAATDDAGNVYYVQGAEAVGPEGATWAYAAATSDGDRHSGHSHNHDGRTQHAGAGLGQ